MVHGKQLVSGKLKSKNKIRPANQEVIPQISNIHPAIFRYCRLILILLLREG